MGNLEGKQQEEEEEEGREQARDGDADRAREVRPPLLDRSKVRILLCDNDAASSHQILQILLSCSYQGHRSLHLTSVKTAGQVIGALNSHGPDIDIILMEVDLPVVKGFKLLKYITKRKELHRIPIITMSAKDEVSVVVQCLRLGAADFLVKPLRMNELLHLWTHMWRRRRMLGLAEKDVLNCDPELGASDPSDGNTNSMTLLSDDMGEKPKRNVNLEASVAAHQELDSKPVADEVAPETLVGDQCTTPEDGKLAMPSVIFSCPKKFELRIGESSAFFTYKKSKVSKGDSREGNLVNANKAPSEHASSWKGDIPPGKAVELGNSTRAWESYTYGNLQKGGDKDSISTNFPVPPAAAEEMQSYLAISHPSNTGHLGLPGVPPTYSLPFFFPGTVQQTAFPPSEEMYRGNIPSQSQGNPVVLPQYAAVPNCHLPAMPSLSYQPVGIEMPAQNMPAQYVWPHVASSLKPGPISSLQMERREAALTKFRQKRKDRCFDKKIRYVNRKRLAERRPRIRGQFVKRSNGVDVDLNGHPIMSDSDDDDDDDDDNDNDDEECSIRENGLCSSSERDVL